MEKITKEISSYEMFAVVKELLAENRQAVFTITGYSMLPFMGSRRDQVVLESCDREKLKVGDIILFQYETPPYDYILHRIYKVTEHGYRTMGDGNDFMDQEITPEQVVGIVTKVYRRGKEIDCSSVGWRLVSDIWRWMKPVRGPLIRLYRRISRTKKRILPR